MPKRPQLTNTSILLMTSSVQPASRPPEDNKRNVLPGYTTRPIRKNLCDWQAKGAALLEKARLQKDDGERLLDDARDRLPKVSQSVKTVRMYLESLKLARRQIDLEREFGLGALRTRRPVGGGEGVRMRDGGGGARGGSDGSQAMVGDACCGLEVGFVEAFGSSYSVLAFNYTVVLL